jgi:REP element-mobilizing transposase RayT
VPTNNHFLTPKPTTQFNVHRERKKKGKIVGQKIVGRAAVPVDDARAFFRPRRQCLMTDENHRTEHFYRRRLPHWRFTESIYFVTWRLASNQQELSTEERGIVAAELQSREGQRYNLHAYVVMNDHAHVLVEPLGLLALERIVHSWKSFTAHQLQRKYGRRGRLWHDEYFDRMVRDEKEYTQKLRYIVGNPWARWPELREYPWVFPEKAE